MEMEANRFAAELLMPKADILPTLSPVTLDRLSKLKPYWRVSMQALLYRASELKVISERKARYLWMQMGKLGYRKREPAELNIPQEKPTLVHELFDVHRKLNFRMQDLETMLLLDAAEICSRYGIERLPDQDDTPPLRLVR
jgi:Zn-dependent peptidase ImmA (M78 family)